MKLVPMSVVLGVLAVLNALVAGSNFRLGNYVLGVMSLAIGVWLGYLSYKKATGK